MLDIDEFFALNLHVSQYFYFYLVKMNQPIPVYSLNNFSAPGRQGAQFQVEVFDAHRHFQVQYPHRHDFFEVLFLIKGSGFHVIDSNKYKIEPPCVFFLSPGQAHKLELSHDIEGFIFIFNAEFYLINRINHNRLLEFPFFYTIQQNNPPLILEDRSNVSFLEGLFQKAVNEVAEKDASVDLLKSILDLVLTLCARLYPSDDGLSSKGKGHLMVKRFYQLVEENYLKNLPVNDYAEMLAVTANHLTQTVKQLTGKTSTEIIRAKQVLEVKRLLVHTNMSVTEIANVMNFADQSYFTKFFKKETGLTPLGYRAEALT